MTSFDQRAIKALFNTLPRGFYSRNYERILRKFNALLAEDLTLIRKLHASNFETTWNVYAPTLSL